MTVLELIQSFCYQINISAPASVAPVQTAPGTLQLIHLFYDVCRELRQAKCWPQLKKNHSFTTSNGDPSYPLPTDFFCSIYDTYWDQTNKRKLAGPLTDSRFNELQFGYITIANQECFRVFGQKGVDQFQLYPTPGTTNLTLSFDYLTKNFLGTGAAPYTWSEAIAANADICAFDDEILMLGLKSKWYQMKGLDYTAFQADFANKVSAAQARWQGNRKVSMYPRLGGLPGLNPNIPEGSFTL